MKSALIPIMCLCFAINALGQNSSDSLGFTNKTEAKNLIVNGLKEGKWIEYIDAQGHTTIDTSAPSYFLVIYIQGERNGIAQQYRKNGTLWDIVPYKNGKMNGLGKIFYPSGKLNIVTPWINGVRNGISKQYYESGVLEREVPLTNNLFNGTWKEYSETGRLKSETVYTNGIEGSTIHYDESGKEIK